ncbi:hypothetical protein [Verrucomicrobium sp. BvORR034]|uniref:hypothetical protein n=1 Tax=Verrucomicrobium sp. BvORR034 TaxID=1396418 RepID=UPI000679B723|nr:hypothetical protein [Verrucomicrobium sp. BvORR034]
MRDYRQIPVSSMEKAGINGAVAKQVDLMRLKSAHPHGNAGHPYYTELVDEALPGVIASMKKDGLDPTRGQSLTAAEAELRASELIKRAVTNSNDAYIKWFDSVSRTESQATIAKASPFAEASNRISKGQPFSKSLTKRIRASTRVGMRGATACIAVLAPILDVNAMAKQVYFESPAGQIDLVAAQLAGDLLPPDKNPGYFGRVAHNLFGTFSPCYTSEREEALRDLHSELRQEMVAQRYGKGSYWADGGIWRID